jgi:flavin-dependent dehydrogenase
MLQKLMPPALYARISEAYSDPCYPDPKVYETISLFDGETGDVVKDITSPGMVRIDRNRLRKLCSTGLPIQYEKSLSSLTYSADGNEVTAHFQDGTTATGNILVGADGARSVVRRELLGEEKSRLSPTSSVSVLMKVNFNDAQKALYARKLNPIIKMAIHPGVGQMSLISSKLLPKSKPSALI